jgi:hypothetical protein
METDDGAHGSYDCYTQFHKYYEAHGSIDNKAISKVAINLVRHNDANESYFCDPAKEGEELAGLNMRGAKLGTKLVAKGMELEIAAV